MKIYLKLPSGAEFCWESKPREPRKPRKPREPMESVRFYVLSALAALFLLFSFLQGSSVIKYLLK